MSLTVTDLFAGAGGSSTGMIAIPGVEVKIAANHWKLAIAVHNQNHPETDHAAVDLHQEDPRFFPRTDILWASPECTKWSQANGTRLPDIEEGLFEDPLADEAKTRSRLLMFDVLRYAEHHRYRRIVVENVVDIATQAKYRLAWAEWRRQLTALGYEFRVVSLNSMHAQYAGMPAPQSRDRLYIVCWLKGDRAPDIDRVMRPLAWCSRCEQLVESRQAWKPGRTVGRYRAQYVYLCSAPGCGTAVEPGWLPAAAAIDWGLPGKRIGDRKEPLADKTRARIAAGIARYWRPFSLEAAGNTYDAADPRHPQHGQPSSYYRAWPADEPLTTLHTTLSKALAVPVEGRDGKKAQLLDDPLRAMTTRAETALVTRHYGIEGGDPARHSKPAEEALRTLTANGGNMSITEPPFIAELKGGSCDARSIDEPLSTFLANGNHHAVVHPAFMLERRHEYRTRSLDEPMSTLTANDTAKALVMDNNHSNRARPVDEELPTLTTATTKALVSPYYGTAGTARPVAQPIGTLTTVDRYALIHRHNTGGAEMLTPAGEPLRTLTTGGHQSLLTPGDIEAAEAMVDDCLFRMLEPYEVAAGMAFPDTYRWDVRDEKGKLPSRRNLVKMAGNAVTPPAARDLMAAVVESLGGGA